MANHDLDDVFANFGCFDDSDVPSLFEDFESLNSLPNAESSPASGSASPEYELMSVCSPASSTSYHDHTYNVNSNNNIVTPGQNTPNVNDPVMIAGSVTPDHDWSPSPGPSPGGSVSSAQEDSSDLLLYLMNEAGVQISEKEAADTDDHDADSDINCGNLAKQQASTTSVSQSSRGRKRHLSNNNNEDNVQEKNRKNAIAARENRLKKKRYIENLEKENKALSTENARLTIDNDQMKSRVCSLVAEVDYLKSVLYNQSTLSGLLKKLGHNSEVRLSSSFQTRKQPGHEVRQLKPTSGGVCLHVNGKDASLEFCAQCGVMAASGPQS